jgi:DNA helicase-2/ATP-dependent DNA helicase PcrA
LANFATRFDSTETFLSELALINTERFAAPGGTVGEDVVMGGDEDEDWRSRRYIRQKVWNGAWSFCCGRRTGASRRRAACAMRKARKKSGACFYVALTRAQDELYVCYPLLESDRARQSVVQRPSRFVTEVPRELLEIWSVAEELPALEESGLAELETPKLLN